MAKYCGNCGAQLEDNAKVCGNCGTLLDNTKVEGLNYTDPARKKKMGKRIKTLIVIIILGGLVFTGFKIGSQYTGCNGQIRKFMNAYENYDIDKIISMNSILYYYYGDEDYIESNIKNKVADTLDYLEDSVGHKYSFSYEINDTYEYSERNLETLLDAMSENIDDLDANAIQKVIAADITVYAKSGNKTAEKDIAVVMSKEGKEWKLLYFE